jgi:hypothetical protein
MRLAPGVWIYVRVENHHAVANNQKTMEWNPFAPHVVEGFSQDSGIETLAFWARCFPSGSRELVGSNRALTERQKYGQQAHSEKTSAELGHHIQQHKRCSTLAGFCTKAVATLPSGDPHLHS